MSTTSSTSSTSSVASFYTSNGVTRLNGSELISGLDTQSLITALTSKTQSKIDQQGQLEQKAEWKQQMYQEIQALMVSFNGTYFSYSNTGTNIMSSKFFDSGALTSSSSMVSATGASSDAGNVVINSISSLATSAALSSGYAPSVENITSGEIQSEWTQSALSGKSLTVTYGGNNYTLTLDSSASLDSAGTTAENLQSIADALNSQIGANSSLSGKLQFSVTGDALELSATSSADSSSVSIHAASSDDADTAAANAAFLNAIGLSSPTASSDGTTLTGSSVTLDSTAVAASPLFNHTVSSSSSLTFSVSSGGTTTPYTIKLGEDVDLSGFSGDDAETKAVQAVVGQLQTQIDANSNLKSANVKVGYDSDTKAFTVSGDGVSVTGGSQNLLTGLGLEKNGDGTYNASGTVSTTDLAASYLGDALAGSTLTVQLNGVSKTITFDANKESSYSDASGLEAYLQTALNTAYGSGKVTVGHVDVTDSGGAVVGEKLTFKTSDTTSIFTMSSSSASNVLDENGALRIAANETNRLETTKTLGELKGELAGLTDSDGSYTISVNGKQFTFTGDTELGTVISTINSDSDAGVNITYSQTLNRFRVTADDTGSQGQISIEDVGGNLAGSLFGVDYSNVYGAALSAGIGSVESAAFAPSDGSYSTGSGDSVYTLTLSDGTSQDVTIAGGQTYASMSDFASAVQGTIDSSSLKGRVTVGTDGDKLTFNVSPEETAGTTLTVAEKSDSAADILGFGATGSTTADVSRMTAADLFAKGVSGITEGTDSGGNTVYTIGGMTVSGDMTLASVGYDGYTNGTDLVMSADLGGGSTATTVTRSTNSFTLDGITMNVTGTTNDKVTFTASGNVDDLYQKISDFVDAYNAIIDKVNTYATQAPYGLGSSNGSTESYEPLTDAQKKEMTDDEITEWNDKAKQGLLQNDQTLDSILSDLRGAMERTVSSAGISLSSIGISTAAYDYTSGGKLEIDETALKNALQTEPDQVEALFTGTGGISAKVKSVLTNYVGEYGNSGILYSIAGSSSSTTASSDQLDQQISQYNETITDLKTQLSDEQDYWQTKFTAMETKLSTLNSQYTYLSSMLGTSSS